MGPLMHRRAARRYLLATPRARGPAKWCVDAPFQTPSAPARTGLAPAPTPAYAMGGAVVSPAGGNSGRPITLVLDGKRFDLSAEDSVAEALTRTALGQQRRRAGRMPAWFGG